MPWKLHSQVDMHPAYDGKVGCNTTGEFCRGRPRRKTTEDHYFPVRLELARLASSLLYGTRAMLGLNLPAFEKKNTQLMKAVRKAKSRPRNNQSKRSDLPEDYLSIYNNVD